MIIDSLEHAQQYEPVLPRLVRAFEFLRHKELSKLPDGRIDIDGDSVYALLQSYRTKPRQGGRPEGHRRYADVQALLAGREVCGYIPVSGNLAVSQAYDATKDFMLFKPADCDFVTLTPGRFAIFFPQDAHLPGCQFSDTPDAIRKVVVKIRIP